ncbi:short chain dehydrogenase [Pseudoalteromonas sp. A25]|uniref:SDR family oxidoreductase n=1 Tax=Pseudoalteromonas sp. A25 TaxID=116092 RepID=UPI00126087C4|nr:SDR family oxidoreductase [Pseudoalteromonas sp. A25]BBN83798.1 short chain dehydrogenase [Pseudoalteromonas sp. A25]
MDKQKLAVITGASGGIGAAIATQLSQAGWRCLLLGRDENKLQLLQRALGEEHQYLALDLTQPVSGQRVTMHAMTLGGAALLVNCAGCNEMRSFQNEQLEQIQQQINVNLLVPMSLMHHLLPQLSSVKGTVVNVGSAFGYIGYPYQSVYCASKFGLRGFSEALSRELDGQVAVKYLAPRATDTRINPENVRALNRALGNKMDTPEEVAHNFMRLLNSKKRRWVVGFPEKLFARVNGLLPELVDSAIIKQLKIIKSYISCQLNTKESSS